jgi:hypothetical protein
LFIIISKCKPKPGRDNIYAIRDSLPSCRRMHFIFRTDEYRVLSLSNQVVCVGVAVASFLVSLLFKGLGWVYASDVATMTVVVTSYLAFAKIDPTTTLIMITGRVAGILVGVLISFLVSFLCFPYSASRKAVEQHQLSLQALAEFGKASWECLPDALLNPETVAPTPPPSNPSLPGAISRTGSLVSRGIPSITAFGRQESFGTWIESVNVDLSNLYSVKMRSQKDAAGSDATNSTAGSDQAQEVPTDQAYWMRTYSQRVLNFVGASRKARDIARHEALVVFCGMQFYFPVWPWKSAAADFPLVELEALGDSTAEVARVLWNLSAAMSHQFAQETLAKIAGTLPPELMPSLKSAAVDVLEKVCLLCPNTPFEEQRDPAEAFEAVQWLDELANLLLELTMYERHNREQHLNESISRRKRSSKKAGGGGLTIKVDDPNDEVVLSTPSGYSLPTIAQLSPGHHAGRLCSDPTTPSRLSRKGSLVRSKSPHSASSLDALPEELSWREGVRPATTKMAKSEEQSTTTTEERSCSGGGFGSLKAEGFYFDPKLLANSKRDLLEQLGGVRKEPLREGFADTPAGFVEAVRWMSFVYELNFYADALFALVHCLNKAARRMPLIRRGEAAAERKRQRRAEKAKKRDQKTSAKSDDEQATKNSSTPADPPASIDCENGSVPAHNCRSNGVSTQPAHNISRPRCDANA